METKRKDRSSGAVLVLLIQVVESWSSIPSIALPRRFLDGSSTVSFGPLWLPFALVILPIQPQSSLHLVRISRPDPSDPLSCYLLPYVTFASRSRLGRQNHIERLLNGRAAI